AYSQSELKVAGIQCASSFSEVRIAHIVVASTAGCSQQEVGTVEYVETLRFELKVHLLGDLEDLAQGHISAPHSWPNECVAAKIASANQARCAQTRRCTTCGGIPTGLPQIAARIEIRHGGIRTIITTVVEVEVSTKVLTIAGVHIRSCARSRGIGDLAKL